MARLPDQQLSAPQGTRPPPDAVQPTDFGLSAVGQSLGQAADMNRAATRMEIRAQAQADSDTAKGLLQPGLEGVNNDFAKSVAGLTPDTAAGFAGRTVDAVGKSLTPYLSQAQTPGVRAEMQRQISEQQAAYGSEARQHESAQLAAPIQQMVENQRNSDIAGGQTAFNASFAPAYEQLQLNHASGDTDLPQKTAALFDQSAAAGRALVKPENQPAYDATMAPQRVKMISDAQTFQLTHAATTQLQQAQDQINVVANTIATAPSSYANAVASARKQILSGLPAGLQEQVAPELDQSWATARIKGLIQAGQTDQAKAEINRGDYNSVLKPPQLEELQASADAAAREKGPKTFDQWMAAYQTEGQLNADLYSRATTGQGTGVNLDAVVSQLGPQRAAKYAQDAKTADEAFSATGATRDMTTQQLQAAATAAPPDHADPLYASKLQVWQAQQQAAQRELKARQGDPGAWAWSTSPALAAGKGGSAAAAGAMQDRGAQLQAMYQAAAAAPGPQRGQLMTRYVDNMLGVQEAAGAPKAGWQVVPSAEASRLAASVTGAQPEQKLAAMQTLAGWLDAIPTRVRAQDGSVIAPRAIAAAQLQAAGLSPIETSALADFGGDPAKLGRVVAALNDPTLKKPLDRADEQSLTRNVTSALQPFLRSQAPLPGGQAMAQARIDRTVLVARGLMAGQNMSAGQAAQAASQDVAGGYVYQQGYRIPVAQTGGLDMHTLNPFAHGQSQVRQGAALALSDLTRDSGAALAAPDGPGTPDDQRHMLAAKLGAHAQWVTNADDSGLTLMLPKTDGSFTPVADRYGRTVSLSWDALKARATGGATAFGSPTPQTLRAPNGQPIPAFTTSRAFQALSDAVTTQESGGRDGLVSAAGALGRMQVTPATAAGLSHQFHEAAPDLNRLQNDGAYNTKYGQAALSGALQRRGGGAGIGLALADYNAGPGRLDGYRDPRTGQWNPGWLHTIGDPRQPGGPSLTDFVNRIPVAETRRFVQAVLPRALAYLQR